jgi:Ser-tRNA(Ala) deacylase AlaX
VKKIRIVEIESFDKTPCKDPHVENTSEIGYFEILKVERKGKDRYRFVFTVK